jgi:LemA protein
MKQTTGILVALVGVAVVVAAWSVLTYNSLVQSRLAVDAQWAQVEAQYQRRVDLIPNLVAAVKGVLGQERAVFQELVLARTAYLSAPPGSPQRVGAANDVERSVGRLLGVVEAYPQLRSVDTVARLMDELAGTENRIAVERRRYNERVRVYDTQVQQFPSALIAASGHFQPRPYFTAAASAGGAPEVTLPKR